MGNLKIHVAIGAFNIEIEGDSAEVITQFNLIKESGLGRIGDMTPLEYVEKSSNDINSGVGANNKVVLELNKTEADTGSALSIFDVVSKGLPNGESEWVLVYGHYITIDGRVNFTRKDIIDMYDKSNRKSKVRIKNLSASVNSVVKNGWMSRLNDSDYLLTPVGKDKAIEILSREKALIKVPKKKVKVVKK